MPAVLQTSLEESSRLGFAMGDGMLGDVPRRLLKREPARTQRSHGDGRRSFIAGTLVLMETERKSLR
jgi:hypothetical protein